MASWLLGFSASWLLGFLASRLLGFSAFYWFMRLLVAFWLWLFASSAFPVPLRQVAFWLLRLFAGLCYAAFGGFGFSHPILAFAPFHWFLDLASRIMSITSSSLLASSLLRTSWGGSPLPPQPTRYCLDCLQSNCTPI